MHSPSPNGCYIYLAALAAGTATACWVAMRHEGNRITAAVEAGRRAAHAGRRAANAGPAVANLPDPELLRAARNLAGKVIASERRRVEDNSEDTPGIGKRR